MTNKNNSFRQFNLRITPQRVALYKLLLAAACFVRSSERLYGWLIILSYKTLTEEMKLALSVKMEEGEEC